MNPFVVGVSSALRLLTRRIREENEHCLIKSACSGVAIMLSCAIGLASYQFGGQLVLGLVTFLAARVLLPVSNLMANSIFDARRRSWITSGDAFKRLRYFDHEYDEGIRRLSNLPLPDTEKCKLIAQRYQEYVDDTYSLRERIKNLNDVSDMKR